ncbi:MAG TPA: hypothetical protein VJM53_09520, partial [Burkholderiales bacterium]|nr:hypothetical protein [Burkholderiales bacterium]
QHGGNAGAKQKLFMSTGFGPHGEGWKIGSAILSQKSAATGAALRLRATTQKSQRRFRHAARDREY